MTAVTFPALDHSECPDVSAAPPIDATTLTSRCMNNASFALALLGEFEAHGPEQVNAIVLQVVHNESLAAAESAHALRGAAAILGANHLCYLAEQIEATGHAGEISRLVELASELRREMTRCLEFLPAIRVALQQS